MISRIGSRFALLLLALLSAAVAAGPTAACRQWIAAAHRPPPAAHGCGELSPVLEELMEAGGAAIPVGRGRFFLAWFPEGWEARPGRRLVISLHGNGGCAERMFHFWHRNRRDHDYAIVALQYAEQDAGGELRFDDDAAIYDHLRLALDDLGGHCPLAGVPVVLHGFSRGSARVFEIAALDRAGDRLFAAFIADSGTVFPEYRGRLSPRLARLDADGYEGARFWLYCGGRDHRGRTCRGLGRMARFVEDHGGVVDALYRHPPGGHGIFITGGPRRYSPALGALFRYIDGIGG